jgi:hypothetical protein
MREANKGLRDQRDIIINVSDKNAQINRGLNEGNKIIVQMSRREFFYKMGLYFVIFALFITIVAVLISKIVNMF